MACNTCAKPYSLLRKEKGCPSCGFSYCSKCLNNKVFITKLNAEAKVCVKCKNSTDTPESKHVEPPDAYYKRIGVMDNKQQANKTSEISKDQHILDRLKNLREGREASQSTTTEDEIRKRLNNIKGEMPSTSDSEIEARLAKLRGVPVENLSSKPALPAPETRSEQEQVNDLLKQYMDQSSIDTKYNHEFEGLLSDMELRMQKLRGTDNPTISANKSPKNVESEDEEEIVNKIVEKVKAEVSLDDDSPQSTSDELPFCEICNEDAKMRCLGCKYLFCKRCFMEHKDDDDGCNRYEAYEAPKDSKH